VQPDNFNFGGGLTTTTMHPLVVIAMIIAILLTLVLPRKYLIVPFLVSAILIPMTQTMVLGGVHFFVLRIIMLFGWIRMGAKKVSSSESLFGNGLRSLDIVFLCWAVFRTMAFLLRFSFQAEAVVNQAGLLWDVIGAYFFLRFAIQDEDDIRRAIRTLGVIACILTVCVLNEKFRAQNIFGYLGGMPVTASMREGSVRPRGPFSHALLCGVFGATLLPLFIWLWSEGKSRVLSACGMISSTIITLVSASSTPLMAYAAGLFGFCLWPIRKRMRLLRWGIVFTLMGLQMAMKAPVWFLIDHVDVIGASSGYHRAMLIDQFIRHFGEWWFAGTSNNANWGWDMWDLSNQFVAEGVGGGLGTFVCFIAIICICFRWIGNARKASEGDRGKEWRIWALGAALFSHIVAFFGVSYWDRTQIYWFAVLAIISAATVQEVAEPIHNTETVDVGQQRHIVARVLAARSRSSKPEFLSRRPYSDGPLKSRRLT
jgi:hypothetical protein